jgi:hypothetical protein
MPVYHISIHLSMCLFACLSVYLTGKSSSGLVAVFFIKLCSGFRLYTVNVTTALGMVVKHPDRRSFMTSIKVGCGIV